METSSGVAAPTSDDAGSLLLAREYSLLPRFRVGQTSTYRFCMLQHHLDQAHSVVAQTKTLGDFERTAQAIRPDGAAIEQITWRAFEVSRREDRTGAWSDPASLPEAVGFSYLFCAEDSYDAFHWDYDRLPSTPLGDSFMLHTINAHFEFDFLRSKCHGAIHQLRRVGDSVLAPDAGRPFTLTLRAVPLTWLCTKRNLTSTLVGVTRIGNRVAAIVAFSTWLDVLARWPEKAATAEHVGNTQFSGHLYIDSRDGSLIIGEFDEWVCLPAVSSETPAYNRIFVEYRITRIPPEELGLRISSGGVGLRASTGSERTNMP